MKRDANQKAGVESGTSEKSKIGDPDLGMGAVGKNQKPAPNPSTKASRGHTIK